MSIQTGTNWKNVNNWHWVEKNCLPWAIEYMNKLKGLGVSDNGVTVAVSEVESVTGDVDLNQRKGKIISIYDVAINMKWKGTDASGEPAEGKVVIPELMHDTDLNDLVFNFTVENDNDKTHAIKEVARKKLCVVIREALGSFAKDLIESHSKDVYIPPENMKGHPVLSTYNPKPPVTTSQPVSAANTSRVGGVVEIKQRIEFIASPHDIYHTLLDQQRACIWTRGNAEICRVTGGEFSLFNGNVSGSITRLIENKTIEMKWRVQSWPKHHYSTVVMNLEEGADETILNLVQKGVPVGEKETTETNWTNYYWNPIKATFGFGTIL
ncbi:Co-chaperone [Batrachochytrium dendrobatidis]|nr:Co-chaperone [Batrachochytrium dendrobatidis]